MAYGKPTVKVYVKFDGVVWTDITSDTIAKDGLDITYGISGTGPLDNVASTGICTFNLQNWDVSGQYSPGHASVIAGWVIGVPIKVTFLSADALTEVVKFVGKVTKIDPDPGRYAFKKVHVTAEDGMGLLANAVVRNIVAQITKTEVELIQAVHSALPASVAPATTSLDTALDSYPYAFYDVSAGARAMGLIKDVIDSAFGLYFQRGDGTHVYMNRESRTYTESVDTITENDMVGLSSSVEFSQLINRFVIETPQVVKGTSIEVLASFSGTDATGIDDGATVEIWANYADPNDTGTAPRSIAGTSMIAPVATTDYTYNSAADGSGTNLTASVSVTATYFTGSVKYTITNSSGSKAYRTLLRSRGYAIRTYNPVTVIAESVEDYGEITQNISLKFQNNLGTAAFIADYLLSQYSAQVDRPQTLSINPHASERLMAHVMEREPGDRISLTETQTGLSADAIINNISIKVSQGDWITCTWGLAPQSSYMFISPWKLGTVGRSEVGTTTVVG